MMEEEIKIDISLIPEHTARALGDATLEFILDLLRDPTTKKMLEAKMNEGK
jgi:hypothetical protein